MTSHPSFDPSSFCNPVGGLSLHVTYTPNYPDELPEFEINVIDGSLPDSLKAKMIADLKTAVRGQAHLYNITMRSLHSFHV